MSETNAEYVYDHSQDHVPDSPECWDKCGDPAEFVEVQRPNEFIATCGGEPLAAADERREQAQKDWESGTALKKWAAQYADAVALTEALEALRLTVEYVGLETLRPYPGWSWFDVLSQRPEYAEWLDSMVGRKCRHGVPSHASCPVCAHNDGGGA